MLAARKTDQHDRHSSVDHGKPESSSHLRLGIYLAEHQTWLAGDAGESQPGHDLDLVDSKGGP